jgi:hypothetical protein
MNALDDISGQKSLNNSKKFNRLVQLIWLMYFQYALRGRFGTKGDVSNYLLKNVGCRIYVD